MDVRNDGRIGETGEPPGEPARVRVSHRPKIFCCSPSLRMPAALARFLGRQPPAAQTPVQDNAAGNGSAAPLELNLLQTVIPTNFSIALNPEDFMQGHDSNLRKDQGVDTSTSAASSSSTGMPEGSTSSMSTSTTSVLLQRQNSVLQSPTKVKSTASSSGSANAALQTVVTPDALPDKSKALVAGGSAAKKGVSFSNVVSVREVESENKGKKAPNRSDEPRASLAASSSDNADSQVHRHTVQPVERPPSEPRASSPQAKPQVNLDTGETLDPVLRSALVKTKDSSSGSPRVGRDSDEVVVRDVLADASTALVSGGGTAPGAVVLRQTKSSEDTGEAPSPDSPLSQLAQLGETIKETIHTVAVGTDHLIERTEQHYERVGRELEQQTETARDLNQALDSASGQYRQTSQTVRDTSEMVRDATQMVRDATQMVDASTQMTLESIQIVQETQASVIEATELLRQLTELAQRRQGRALGTPPSRAPDESAKDNSKPDA